MLKTYKNFKISSMNDLAVTENLLKFASMCEVEKIRENLNGGIHTYIHHLSMEPNLEILMFTRSNILLGTKYIKVVIL